METIKHHETRKNHLYVAYAYVNESSPKEAAAFKARLSLNKEIYAKLTTIVRTVHAISIQERQARGYLWMDECDTTMGILESVTRVQSQCSHVL